MRHRIATLTAAASLAVSCMGAMAQQSDPQPEPQAAVKRSVRDMPTEEADAALLRGIRGVERRLGGTRLDEPGLLAIVTTAFEVDQGWVFDALARLEQRGEVRRYTVGRVRYWTATSL